MKKPFIYTVLWLISVMIPWNALMAQRSKSVVLNYKFSSGDQYRISVSSYKNFSTSSKLHAQTSYGDMSYDLEMRIEKSDGDVYDAVLKAVLTRYTRDGINLTYKLADVFRNYQWLLAFDRFGRILDESIRQQKNQSAADSADIQVIQGSMIFLLPFPDYAVKVNDKWLLKDFYDAKKITELIRPEWNITEPSVTGEYLLESIDGGVARVVSDILISGRSKLGDAKGRIETEMMMRFDGRYDFDITKGRLINGSVTVISAGIGRTGSTDITYDGSQTISINFEKIK